MYDLFFISYEEPLADQHWEKLKSRFDYAKRVHGITGIENAHKKCAELSYTSMFWTIDGDTTVDDNWEFDYIPPKWDRNYLHLWYSRNPVNGLEYGYGGVKLWPTNLVKKFNKPWVDFTGSVGQLKIIDTVVSTTNFNTSPYETWKSSFRETVKLLKNVENCPDDIESIDRLQKWAIVDSDAQYHKWCIIGTNDAKEWYKNSTTMDYINDFGWLKEYFKKYIV
jgi:hypothetical protein